MFYFICIYYYICGSDFFFTRGTKKNEKVRGIEYCWKEQARKSLSRDEQRIIAFVCEEMEDKYKTLYKRSP